MEYTVKISPQAHDDIRAIRDYIIKDGLEIANKQAAIIYDALGTLAVFPKSGIDLNNYVNEHTDYRFIVIRKIYLAFYKINGNEVEVYRIFRGEQDYINILDLM